MLSVSQNTVELCRPKGSSLGWYKYTMAKRVNKQLTSLSVKHCDMYSYMSRINWHGLKCITLEDVHSDMARGHFFRLVPA